MITIIECAYVASCTCGARLDSHAWPCTDQAELEACQSDAEENHGWYDGKCPECAKAIRDESYDERGEDDR
jgi:hypothetical protein